MFENRRQPLLPIPKFLGRMAGCLGISASLMVSALGTGTLGYHACAHLPWIDALLNAAMILTGMGPVDPLKSTGAKLFATGFCLVSGLVFLSAMTITLTPIFHRILHHLHLSDEDLNQQAQARPPVQPSRPQR